MTTLRPGEEARLSLRFTMHAGMGGQHEFRVHLLTNDRQEPAKWLTVRSNWVP